MKRLLRVSFDQCIFSLVPIACWFILGILVDSRLINIFILTYPLQFVYCLFISVFSTGANVCKEKDEDDHAVMSGLIIGTISSSVVFMGIASNIDSYIEFMNMDVEFYRIFGVYSVLDLYVCLIYGMVLNKLYFEEKNVLANKYTIIFNALKFIALAGMVLITKKQAVIAIVSLVPMSLFTAFIFISHCDSFRLKFNIIRWMRYDSSEFFSSLAYFLTYLFGFSNALSFGVEYGNALTFISLITDTQWDTLNAVSTVATIDISKGCFNYKDHLKNAYKLLTILIASSLTMFGLLFGFFYLNLAIAMIYLCFNIAGFMLFPLFKIKTCYLQVEGSAFKVTSNKLLSSSIETALSFLRTPYCTSISLVCSFIYQVLSICIMFDNDYKIEHDGYVIEKKRYLKLLSKELLIYLSFYLHFYYQAIKKHL